MIGKALLGVIYLAMGGKLAFLQLGLSGEERMELYVIERDGERVFGIDVSKLARSGGSSDCFSLVT